MGDHVQELSGLGLEDRCFGGRLAEDGRLEHRRTADENLKGQKMEDKRLVAGKLEGRGKLEDQGREDDSLKEPKTEDATLTDLGTSDQSLEHHTGATLVQVRRVLSSRGSWMRNCIRWMG